MFIICLVVIVVISNEGVGGFCNFFFIYVLVLMEGDVLGEVGKLLVVVWGDGVVDVFDFGFESSDLK